jgi:hypothetical protein
VLLREARQEQYSFEALGLVRVLIRVRVRVLALEFVEQLQTYNHPNLYHLKQVGLTLKMECLAALWFTSC